MHVVCKFYLQKGVMNSIPSMEFTLSLSNVTKIFENIAVLLPNVLSFLYCRKNYTRSSLFLLLTGSTKETSSA